MFTALKKWMTLIKMGGWALSLLGVGVGTWATTRADFKDDLERLAREKDTEYNLLVAKTALASLTERMRQQDVQAENTRKLNEALMELADEKEDREVLLAQLEGEAKAEPDGAAIGLPASSVARLSRVRTKAKGPASGGVRAPAAGAVTYTSSRPLRPAGAPTQPSP